MNRDRKRHLPLVASGPAEPEGPPRPTWQWIGLGALGVLLVWLPLAWVGMVVSRGLVVARVGAGEVEMATLPPAVRWSVIGRLAAPQLLALLLAGAAGGALVTRLGTGTRVRDGAAAGLAVGMVGFGLTCAEVGWSTAALIVPLVATGAAALGAALAKR